jgi:hypothetical protein
MSPRAGFVLLEEIAPRLKAIIPHIKPVGAEDAEELLQDALALAAKMLHDLEARGKTVTPGNVAYYTILHIRSGRRSYSAGRTDVMNAGTQLDGLSSVMSFEEPAGFDPETGEEIPLGDMLAGNEDDPAGAAARAVEKNIMLVRRKARRVQEWEEGSWGVILLAVMEDGLTSNNYCSFASGILPRCKLCRPAQA